ncbi:MAG TPA: PQQ-dependent sugar dehydrogenase [Gemmatimonadales bacterium]
MAMLRSIPGLLAASLACSGSTGPSGGNPLPPGNLPLTLATVATRLDFPLDLTAPRNDPRLFVVEKTGRIRVIEDGAVLPAPFLDLHDRVSGGPEQGLLGLAFDPAYSTNGRFVVNYTDLNGDTRISAFRVSADPDVADVSTETVLLAVPQPFPNHNGGGLAFGPDGYLYAGLGDGGGGGDPNGNGQSLATLLGKLLRIDLNGGTPYAVPPDNPFAAAAGPATRGEIWSYGLRNPWRFSFDRLTHDLYIGDVGQDAHEEIDVAPAPGGGGGGGLNFGWNRMEGAHCYPPTAGDACDRAGLTLPVVDYDHGQGCSVTGGYVYRGAAIPDLQGVYLYGDYCQGFVRSFRFAGGQATDQRDWQALRPSGNVTSFGEDAAGEVYVLTAQGGVYRIVSLP